MHRAWRSQSQGSIPIHTPLPPPCHQVHGSQPQQGQGRRLGNQGGWHRFGVSPVRSEKSRHFLRRRRIFCLLTFSGRLFVVLCGCGSVGAEHRLLRDRVAKAGCFVDRYRSSISRAIDLRKKVGSSPRHLSGTLARWRSMKIRGRSLNTHEYACAARPFMPGDCRRSISRPHGVQWHPWDCAATPVSAVTTDFRSTQPSFQTPLH